MLITPRSFEASRILKAIDAVEAELTALTANLTECEFQAPPRTGGWSIAYCIEHLTLCGNAFLARWETALASQSVPLAGEHAQPYSWVERRILHFVEPPYKIKSKAGKPLTPRVRRPMQETMRAFVKMHRELAARVAKVEGLHVNRIKIESPCLSWIRYPLGTSIDLALAHERRHLWQAWQVRQQQVQLEDCA